MKVRKKTKKMRLLSTLLMMCMVFTLLPMTALADTSTPITSIHISGLTPPVPGEKPDYDVDVIVDPEGGCSLALSDLPESEVSNIKNGVAWYDDGGIMSPDETFIEGEEYEVVLFFKLNLSCDYYESSPPTCKINGNDVDKVVPPFYDTSVFQVCKYYMAKAAPISPSVPDSSTPAPADSKPVDANAGQKAVVKEALAGGAKELKLTYTEGNKIVDKEIFQNIAGKDITVTFNMGDAWWIVKGTDIPTDMDFKDLNLGVIVDSDGTKNLVPVQVINPLTGEVKTVQCELLHNGPFGFKMSLHVKLGQEYSGMTALLRYYNEATGVLEDVTEGVINADGIVLLPMEHASKYVISIGTAGMSKQNTPAQTTPVQAPVQSAPKSPKTGEDGFSAYYLVLIAVAGIGIVLAGTKRKALK